MQPPPTAYVEGVDGSDIAYQVGGRGPTLVFISGVSNVETRWDYEPRAKMLRRFMSFCRLVSFDQRGMGASGPVTGAAMASWEQWAEDVERVLSAVGAAQSALFLHVDAAPMGLLFAATRPERVTQLIVWNGTVRGWADDEYPIGIRREDQANVQSYLRRVWGTEEAVSIITNTDFADRPAEAAAMARYHRTCLAPSEFAVYMRRNSALDARGALALVQAPTLILHRRDHPMMSVENGRYMAARIPNAKLVELSGGETDLWAAAGPEDPVALIEEFITGKPPRDMTDRALSTVLFTDIVRSTETAIALGDHRWRQLLDRHDEASRRAVTREFGTVVKTTGDGVLATFDSPTRALRAAIEIRDTLGATGVAVRAGVHTGEIELRDDDIGGVAVHIAARVQASASTGTVFASRTVKDLVGGSGLRFTPRGLHELKGLAEPWELFEVEGPEAESP